MLHAIIYHRQRYICPLSHGKAKVQQVPVMLHLQVSGRLKENLDWRSNTFLNFKMSRNDIFEECNKIYIGTLIDGTNTAPMSLENRS